METSASSKTMNNPTAHNAKMHNEFQGIETTMREKNMGTAKIGNAASDSKQKLVKGCAICAAFLALSFTAPRVHAATASELNANVSTAEEQQGKQRSGDRVVV